MFFLVFSKKVLKKIYTCVVYRQYFTYLYCMPLAQSTLIKKIELTSDVFELHYKSHEIKNMIPWQFITFILPGIWGRAYSILELDDTLIKLIIKRWSSEMWGRWGSMFLCDAHIWDTFNYVGPNGHFTLTSWDVSRCFLGTGTWFVPLYNQILWSLSRWDSSKISFAFWVRTEQDLFYTQELENLSLQYSNFTYYLYLSKESSEDIKKWYVTDFITEENSKTFKEFYICWAPAMIESSQEKLETLWVAEKQIYFEKY